MQSLKRKSEDGELCEDTKLLKNDVDGNLHKNPEEGCTASQSQGDETTFEFSSEPSLEQIRQMQDNFVNERNWEQYHTPRNILLAMVGEVGELAELFQWRSEVQKGLPDWNSSEKTDLANELSDVLIYLVRLADRCHIDLPTAVINKFKLNAEKYPVSKVYGSSKKYTHYQNSEEK